MFAVHISHTLMRSSHSHLSRAVCVRTPLDSLYFGHCRSFKRLGKKKSFILNEKKEIIIQTNSLK